MNKKKVIFLSPVDFFKGGAERSLFDLLPNPHITPILVAPSSGDILDKGKELGLECHVIDFGNIHTLHRPFSFIKALGVIKSLFISARNLKKLAKETNAEIIHSNGLKAHAINCVSRWMGGAKSVLHIRDIPYTKAEILVWKILKTLCNKMVLVSHACWPGSTLPDNVVVIHNGTPLIDTNFQSSKGLNNHIQFGFIGRIHPAKGLHLVIEWIADAKEKGFPVSLTVRGTYSEDAPTYETEITALIQKLELQEIVTFTGFIDDSVTLYKDIDIVVVPSKTPDPLPRSVMEAMARGIPVFGYPAGGIFEMIEDKKTGFLVNDSSSFIEATKTITSNPDAIHEMTGQAKKKIEDEFSITNLHQSLNKVYKTI